MICSVNTASASAALPHSPDPHPDPATGSAPALTATGYLLGLLHRLIDYGKELAQTVQRRTTIDPGTIPQQFGTLNIILILTRIVRGLRLATALEARLVRHPLREEAAPADVRVPSECPPRPVRPAVPRASRAQLPLSDVPTAEEIAAALRSRPVGEVIADICRDLGIGPSHPLWREIMTVVIEFGGNIVRLLNDVLERQFLCFTDPAASEGDGQPTPGPQAAVACGTGPP
jgi:hypothetical protein